MKCNISPRVTTNTYMCFSAPSYACSPSLKLHSCQSRSPAPPPPHELTIRAVAPCRLCCVSRSLTVGCHLSCSFTHSLCLYSSDGTQIVSQLCISTQCSSEFQLNASPSLSSAALVVYIYVKLPHVFCYCVHDYLYHFPLSPSRSTPRVHSSSLLGSQQQRS